MRSNAADLFARLNLVSTQHVSIINQERTFMENQSLQTRHVKPIWARELSHRNQKLDPIRLALVAGTLTPEDIGYLSSGERSAVLLAARFEHELDSPLFTFLRLDDDLQAFVLVSRERGDLIGSRIAANL
jgi:hypothetical protein